MFYESGNTPVENELFTISVNIVVIGSEIILELILRMLNGSFTHLVLVTMRTMQIIPSLLISAKFVKDKIGKSRISWLFDERIFSKMSLMRLNFSRKYSLN